MRQTARPSCASCMPWLIVMTLLLSGCVAAPPMEEAPPEPPLAPAAPLPPAPVVYGNFPSGTLHELLVAEMSLRRGDFAPALDRYAAAARVTRDPGVVARAARLAAVTRDSERALTLGLLWAEVAPEDPAARHSAAVALLEAGRFDDALAQLTALHDLGGDADLGFLHLQGDDLAPGARADLLRALTALAVLRPDDAELAFARATMFEQAGRVGDALAVLDATTAGRAGTEAVLLRTRLLESSGDGEAAVALLRTVLGENADAPVLRVSGRTDPGRFRYTLARLLIDQGDLDGAREQFELLLEVIGESAEVLLSLALITLEQDRLEDSRGYLGRLLRTGRRPNTAHYFLGMVLARAGDPEASLDAWSRVAPGFEFARAQAAAAELLLRERTPEALRAHLEQMRRRYPEEAVMLWLLEGQALLDSAAPAASVAALSAGIAGYPDQVELLYARAMAHDAAGSLEGLEEDLVRILELDPEDPMALNALGYTLADRTDRLDEARELVERALALDPNEPAYVDSLGWVEFRAGNLQRAVELLERAFAEFPNHEVAAHLGEALWMSGDHERALGIWRVGLGLDQATDVLQRTLERLLDADTLEALGGEQSAGSSPERDLPLDTPMTVSH